MTITEYADSLNVDIEIIYYHNQNRYSAAFKGAEISDSGCLIGAYGNGSTPNDALKDYVDRIKGKSIVFNAYSDRRRTYEVPQSLSVKTSGGMFA